MHQWTVGRQAHLLRATEEVWYNLSHHSKMKINYGKKNWMGKRTVSPDMTYYKATSSKLSKPRALMLSLWVPPFALRNVMTWLSGWGPVSPAEDAPDTLEHHLFEDQGCYHHSTAGHMMVILAVYEDQHHWQRPLSALASPSCSGF